MASLIKPLKKVLEEYFLSVKIEENIIDSTPVLFITVKTYSNKTISTKLKLGNQWSAESYNEWNVIEVIKDLTIKLIELDKA